MLGAPRQSATASSCHLQPLPCLLFTHRPAAHIPSLSLCHRRRNASEDAMNSPTASSSTADSPRPSDISAGKRPAANLRFQRRTSERAYLEGAYRDGSIITSPDLSAQRESYIGGMDYSAGAAGSSPWASSPEASRQSFGDQVEAGESLSTLR